MHEAGNGIDQGSTSRAASGLPRAVDMPVSKKAKVQARGKGERYMEAFVRFREKLRGAPRTS
jgi:hypothetical protein